MRESSSLPKIHDPFWSPRQKQNREVALLYQWEQYEKCGTVENFRLAASGSSAGRRGFFYTDSDLHKWADAVSRSLKGGDCSEVEILLNSYIELMGEAQDEDGYLFTWNQIYFPEVRWMNLAIEHELYTAGHFIEAGISHYEATGSRRLLDLSMKTADLIVFAFRGKRNASPGHQEIETALFKLHSLFPDRGYGPQAEAFLSARGRKFVFGFHLLCSFLSHSLRVRKVHKTEKKNLSTDMGFEFGENMTDEEPPFIMFRSFSSFFSGSYQQEHRKLSQQREPKGHAVRWVYMMQAAAMSARQGGGQWRAVLEQSWTSLLKEKMYITGGIGSLPVIEGFGRKYEMNNRFSYSETCASIGMVFWCHEMNRLTGEAPYADMIERQLYNGAAVGISQDGKSYFYRNPLESDGTLERHGWFETACCPSNISRLWGDLSKYISFIKDDVLYINQYLGFEASFHDETGDALSISMESAFPWEGKTAIQVKCKKTQNIKLRIPGWAGSWTIRVNGQIENINERELPDLYPEIMTNSIYVDIKLDPGFNEISMDFPMDVIMNRSDPKVRDNAGRVALSRGPLVYCKETEEVEDIALDLSDCRFAIREKPVDGLTELGVINASGREFIPYFHWGNRGRKAMKVWVKEAD